MRFTHRTPTISKRRDFTSKRLNAWKAGGRRTRQGYTKARCLPSCTSQRSDVRRRTAGQRKYLIKRETPAATSFPRYFEENTCGGDRYRKISFLYFSIACRRSSGFYYRRERNRNFHEREFYQATLAEVRRDSLKFAETREFVWSIERETDAERETKAERAPEKDTGSVATRDKGCRGIWRYQNFRCFSITIASGRCEYARRVPLRRAI